MWDGLCGGLLHEFKFGEAAGRNPKLKSACLAINDGNGVLPCCRVSVCVISLFLKSCLWGAGGNAQLLCTFDFLCCCVAFMYIIFVCTSFLCTNCVYRRPLCIAGRQPIIWT